MRKFLIFCCLWLALAEGVFASETLTLTDGTSVSGDIVKSDDVGVMIHTTSDSYPSYQWMQFSQDSLKELAANPKLRAYVEPLIEPTAADVPPPPEIPLHPVTRMQAPDELHPSLLGGLVHSSLGLFMLLVLYAANLYAAYEIGVVRGKPVPAVVALAAILPIIGPIIFLALPLTPVGAAEEAPEASPDAGPGNAAPGSAGAAPKPGMENIEVVASSWQSAAPEEKKPEPQVFSRGKFTLNKRFIETKFAGFIGEPKGDATRFSMEIKTAKATIVVECFKQLGASESILETPLGQVTLPYGDIQEIKLIPKAG